MVSAAVACFVFAAGAGRINTSGDGRTLVVTMTNDAETNQIKVYDADSRVLLQTLSTHGKGGVGGNARGVKQLDGRLVAAVNNGSNTVALFRRDGESLRFDKLVSTSSAPVSVDFRNGHLYVAGATTVDSFVLRENSVQSLDGTADLTFGAPITVGVADVNGVAILPSRGDDQN